MQSIGFTAWKLFSHSSTEGGNPGSRMIPTSRAWRRKSSRASPVIKSRNSAGEAQETTAATSFRRAATQMETAAPALNPMTKIRPGSTSGRRPRISSALSRSVAHPRRSKFPPLSPAPRKLKIRTRKPSRQNRSARRGYPRSSVDLVSAGMPWQTIRAGDRRLCPSGK